MILSVENLYCFRGEFPILARISFDLDYGQIISLHGPNGSGKTTLLKTLAQIIPAEKGKIINNSLETCLMGHENCLKFDLTVFENLKFWADIYKNPSINSDISTLGLVQILDVPVRQLSAGQKRKVSLARLLISKSKLWLLDEPDASLDEDNRKLLNKIMASHLLENGAIIIATHSTLNIKNVLPIDITRYKRDENKSINQFVHGFQK